MSKAIKRKLRCYKCCHEHEYKKSDIKRNYSTNKIFLSLSEGKFKNVRDGCNWRGKPKYIRSWFSKYNEVIEEVLELIYKCPWCELESKQTMKTGKKLSEKIVWREGY